MRHINCIIIDDEKLARDYLTELISRSPYLNLVGTFANALEAVPAIRSDNVQLVYCDIQMPELNGIQFLKTLKHPPMFVFITANPGYAVESYELDGLDYLVKPFSFERFLKSVDRALERLVPATDRREQARFLHVKERMKTMLINFEDIYYIHGNKDFVHVVTREKKFIKWGTMKSIEPELPEGRFLRVHKSYIINLSYVFSVEPSSVKLHDIEEKIPVSANHREELYRSLKI
ncbi:MAG: LytTR family DNA-binding domain-containing protein [Pseudosphingobacterium sp.]|nr:LytTR family DNA-binding domain-containing protein [Pseudosphingobacterium sp.]